MRTIFSSVETTLLMWVAKASRLKIKWMSRFLGVCWGHEEPLDHGDVKVTYILYFTFYVVCHVALHCVLLYYLRLQASEARNFALLVRFLRGICQIWTTRVRKRGTWDSSSLQTWKSCATML